jgi:LPS-assembly lipoprotein
VAAFALAGGIAGCGFHLRGDVTYAFSTIFINAPANVPLTAELKRALAGGSATLTDSAAAAQVIFDISNVTDDKQVLSLSSGGRAREYLLTKRVTFALHDAGGRDWLPAAEIVIRRSFTFSESEVLAREAQEAKLYKEMQTDAVQQIVRRLQFATKPV